MNALFFKKLVLALLLCFALSKPINLPKTIYPQILATKERANITSVKAKYNFIPFLLKKQHFNSESGIDIYINSTGNPFTSFHIIIPLLIILLILIVDLRQWIMKLLASYFEGNKYKTSFHK